MSDRPNEGAASDRGVGEGDARLAPLLSAITVPVEVKVGTARVPLRELLEMAPGSVVALECSVEDPVEVVVGGQTIARAELVSIEGRLGVRIIEIVAPEGEGRSE